MKNLKYRSHKNSGKVANDVMKNGILLGAIGVSGATGDEDEQCANAALLAVDEYL